MNYGLSTTPRYRFFLWAVTFLTTAQLVLAIDYATVWPGAEAWLLAGAYVEGVDRGVLSDLWAGLSTEGTYWLLAWRLPVVILALAAAVLFYRWGRPLFGKEVVTFTLLVAAASLLLPAQLKQASYPAWSFGPALWFWLSVWRYVKSPSRFWWWSLAGSSALLLLVAQVNGLVLLLLLSLAVYRRFGLVIFRMARAVGIGMAVFFLVVVLTGGNNHFLAVFGREDWWLDYGWLLLYSVIGAGPFLGFLMAGLRDLVYKWRRGEELAYLLVTSLLAAFLAQSLLFPFLLALLCAKQLQLFFDERYPWGNWVKTFSILHLIGGFLVIFLILIMGFAQFEAAGYRAWLGCCLAYWLFSFVAVIGLFGPRRDYLIGGSVLAGVVALLFFWGQVYPYFEVERNWPQRLVAAIGSTEEKPAGVVRLPPQREASNAAPYFARAGYPVVFGETRDTFAEPAWQLTVVPADTVFSDKANGIVKNGRTGLWTRRVFGLFPE